MGAGRRRGEGAGRQQGLRPAPALAALCPAHSAPPSTRTLLQGQIPLPRVHVSAPALIQPSPNFMPHAHSPLAQALLALHCPLLPLLTAPIVTHPLCCHRRQSASHARPCLASPGLASPLLLRFLFFSLFSFLFSSPLFFSLLFSSSLASSFSSSSPSSFSLPFLLFFFSIVPRSRFFFFLSFYCGEPTPHQGPDTSCGS